MLLSTAKEAGKPFVGPPYVEDWLAFLLIATLMSAENTFTSNNCIC
jgi:hypothetical protein